MIENILKIFFFDCIFANSCIFINSCNIYCSCHTMIQNTFFLSNMGNVKNSAIHWCVNILNPDDLFQTKKLFCIHYHCYSFSHTILLMSVRNSQLISDFYIIIDVLKLRWALNSIIISEFFYFKFNFIFNYSLHLLKNPNKWLLP